LTVVAIREECAINWILINASLCTGNATQANPDITERKAAQQRRVPGPSR
jgi:hypothetical protein